MAALGSLMANYTDSEEEEEAPSSSNPSRSTQGTPRSGLGPGVSTAASSSNPGSAVSTPRGGTTGSNKKSGLLVSYVNEEEDDEDDDDDDEGEEKEEEEEADNNANAEGDKDDDQDGNPVRDKSEDSQRSVPMDLESSPDKSDDKEEGTRSKKDEEDDEDDDNLNKSGIMVDAWTDGVQLPSEPTGEVCERLRENINRCYRKKIEKGFDMNTVIQNRKGFRNPSIYEKLIQFCEIDEHGTNFPKELYDGHLFGKESYYEELAKVQKLDMERREKIAQSKKEAAAAIAKRQQREAEASGQTKRKSKWDQVGPTVPGATMSGLPSGPPTTSALPPVVRPPPTLVSASASSSSKSIPAFGPIKR